MYRAMCSCGGHVDFKRTYIQKGHHCITCGILLVSTVGGNIYPLNGARIKGYFKVGNGVKE